MLKDNNLCYFEPEEQGCISRKKGGWMGGLPLEFFWGKFKVLNDNNLCYFEPDEQGCIVVYLDKKGGWMRGLPLAKNLKDLGIE